MTWKRWWQDITSRRLSHAQCQERLEFDDMLHRQQSLVDPKAEDVIPSSPETGDCNQTEADDERTDVPEDVAPEESAEKPTDPNCSPEHKAKKSVMWTATRDGVQAHAK